MNTKKEKKRKKLYFSIDVNLCEKFEQYVEENLLSQSLVLEKLVEEFMKNKEKAKKIKNTNKRNKQ